jgi:uncharacterized membrane protein YjdF
VKFSHGVAAGALVVFFAAAILRGNNEFLFYGVTLLLILTGLFFLDRRFDFSPITRWAFNLWMLLHLAGGMMEWSGVRLYDVVLIPLVGEPYQILKYDQLVHIYCYLVVSALVYEVLRHLVQGATRFDMLLITLLAAMGVGALNEVIEFAAVVLVGSTGVGGYTNTLLDLVANFTGALMGAAWRVYFVGSRDSV